MARVRPLTTDIKPRALESEELLLMAVLEQAVADLDHPCPAVRADADVETAKANVTLSEAVVKQALEKGRAWKR
jgi:hypothetical protein